MGPEHPHPQTERIGYGVKKKNQHNAGFSTFGLPNMAQQVARRCVFSVGFQTIALTKTQLLTKLLK